MSDRSMQITWMLLAALLLGALAPPSLLAQPRGIWPFNRNQPAAASSAPAANAPSNAAAPGATPNAGGVQQAGYQAPGSSINNVQAAPSKSLDGVPDERPWLHRFGSKLTAENLSASFDKAIGQGPNEAVARAAFAAGESAMRAQQYDEAAKQYKIAAKRWPDSLLQEDAMFMRGEALFFAERYSKAVDVWVELVKKYENSRHLDKVLAREFAIARYWDEVSRRYNGVLPNFTDKKRPILNTGANATALYDTIRLNDPTGPLADDAVFAAGVKFFLDERYEEADHNFDTVRKEYPRSEHFAAAQQLGLRSKMRSYQGAEYEERPLAEADKLIDSIRLQSPNLQNEERDRLQRAQRAIRAQRAEREFNNGEYYYRRKYYGSAKFYYQAVITKYPETPAAETAARRIAETQNLPDEPPDYFGWLGKLLGESDRQRR